jgi:excisionase family DNA binding protein
VDPARDQQHHWDDDDPCRHLAQALAAVIRQAVKEAVSEAVAEISPYLIPPADPVLVMNVPEAPARIGLSESKTKRLIAAGEIASIPMGRRRKVPVAAIDAYLHRLGREQLRLPGIDPAG